MKYIIISTSRTGSTYLSRFLSSILNCNNLAEPFNEINMPVYNKEYVKNLIELTKNSQNIVLKTHINQLDRLKKKEKDYFLNKDEWNIILLFRHDLFAETFSSCVAEILRNHNDRSYTSASFKINSTLFFGTMKAKIKNWIKKNELKQLGLYHKIIYFEDFTFDPKIDIKLLDLEYKENNFLQQEYSKTPYDKIDVVNKSKLEKLFKKRIQNFNHEDITNNSGWLTLK